MTGHWTRTPLTLLGGSMAVPRLIVHPQLPNTHKNRDIAFSTDLHSSILRDDLPHHPQTYQYRNLSTWRVCSAKSFGLFEDTLYSHLISQNPRTRPSTISRARRTVTASRSPRPTVTPLSREPTPSSEETTDTLCTEPCELSKKRRRASARRYKVTFGFEVGGQMAKAAATRTRTSFKGRTGTIMESRSCICCCFVCANGNLPGRR
ncbi:hypothetical protein F4778DRAFT_147532 [Xylariomycetidae sp. FL2044]|nr:hypothetical protein F4778DRAFT_147532 [Xylariomycetidae sp. FL2044]